MRRGARGSPGRGDCDVHFHSQPGINRQGWDSAQSKNARHIPCAQQPLRRIVLSPDGTALAVLTDDGEVSLWSMRDNACLQRWRIQNTTSHDLCFIGGAHRLGVACADGQIRVIEVGKPAAVPGLLDSQRPPPDRTFIFAPPAGMSRDIRGATVLAANSDSSIFSAGFDHGSAIMWSSRSLLPVMRATCDGVTALSFSPAGDLLAIGTNTGGVLVLSTAPASKAEIGRLAQLLGNIMPTDGR